MNDAQREHMAWLDAQAKTLRAHVETLTRERDECRREVERLRVEDSASDTGRDEPDDESKLFPVDHQRVEMPSGERYYGASPADAQGFAHYLRWQRNVIAQKEAENERLSVEESCTGEAFLSLRDEVKQLTRERDEAQEEAEGQRGDKEAAENAHDRQFIEIRELREQLVEINEARCKALREVERMRARLLYIHETAVNATKDDGGRS